MIITKNVYVTINPRNYNYYKKLGYNDLTCGYNIEIPTRDLSRGSNINVECRCENCGKIKTMMYKTYIYLKNKNGSYSCRKCSQKNIENTNKKLYGYNYATQNDDIKNKIRNTNLKRYNVENISQLDKIKDDKIRTNNERYGVDWPTQNTEVKRKMKKTKLSKRGIDLL
jgi:hypothetical protein